MAWRTARQSSAVIAAREARKAQARAYQIAGRQARSPTRRTDNPVSGVDPRKAAVEAAIARAKGQNTYPQATRRQRIPRRDKQPAPGLGRRSAQGRRGGRYRPRKGPKGRATRIRRRRRTAENTAPDKQPADNPVSGVDPRKAAVEAAIARAKARKAAQHVSAGDATAENTAPDKQPADNPVSGVDPRKAAVEAAIARTKARKAAQHASAGDATAENTAPDKQPADNPASGGRSAQGRRGGRHRPRQSPARPRNTHPQATRRSRIPRPTSNLRITSRASIRARPPWRPPSPAQRPERPRNTHPQARRAENTAPDKQPADNGPGGRSAQGRCGGRHRPRKGQKGGAQHPQRPTQQNTRPTNSADNVSGVDPRKAAVEAAIARAKGQKGGAHAPATDGSRIRPGNLRITIRRSAQGRRGGRHRPRQGPQGRAAPGC
jgi:uncharacterized small protein (DUF1192 family)